MRLRINLLFVLSLLTIAGCGGKKEAANTEEYVANAGTAEKGAPIDPFAAGAALVKGNGATPVITRPTPDRPFAYKGCREV